MTVRSGNDLNMPEETCSRAGAHRVLHDDVSVLEACRLSTRTNEWSDVKWGVKLLGNRFTRRG